MSSTHVFKDLVATTAGTFYARCTCATWSGLPTTREQAYDDFVDHMLAQPEFMTELDAALERISRLPAPEVPDPPKRGLLIRRPNRPRPSLDFQPVAPVPPLQEIDAPQVERDLVWVVGTHPDCDWVIQDDPTVSARHCVLVRRVDGSWTVEDLQSAQGTWILRKTPDGRARLRVTVTTSIMEGDRIYAGDTRLDYPPPGAPVND